MKYKHLSDYVIDLLSKGELILSKGPAMEQLSVTDEAMRNSIKRLVASKKILPLMRGYYLIVPPEYKQLGLVPPELFIHDLMTEIDVPYYVGLLSAASFQGATHQAAQIFQVMVNTRLKPISLGQRTHIMFYFNKRLLRTPLQQLKTDRGPLNISIPEATAFDLIRYVHQSGNLNHVATLLDELAEHMSSNALIKTAKQFSLVYAQRLGYLLEYLGHDKLQSALWSYIQERKPSSFPLLGGGKNHGQAQKNDKWHLAINEKIESDL